MARLTKMSVLGIVELVFKQRTSVACHSVAQIVLLWLKPPTATTS